jgi:tetratricopeptide (TPR) repeat protein
MEMKNRGSIGRWFGAAVLALLASGVVVEAQDSQDRPTLNKDKQQQQTQQAQLPSGTTLTLDTVAPASADEDTAFKALQALPEGAMANLQAKLQAGEDFLQKYPQSHYRPMVYAFLTLGYIQIGQADKGISFGDKELELNPNDVATMAVISQTIPRVLNSSAPDAAKRLDKAETLGKRAVEIIPTIPKPEGLTDEVFMSSKNQTLAMAHSGLGLVNWRRGKYADAIPELEQSVKLDTIADPVNWFVLGVVNQNTSHFDDAAGAFAKCATIPGKLQDTCKTKTEEAKKLATTKLSVPK